MEILIIDGQGGGIGRALITALRAQLPDQKIVAAGTNALATAAMLKAGATIGVTGENAILYNCRHAEIIAGPIGIVLANAMYGELTPAIAQAVGESEAQRVLIPVSKSHTVIAGAIALPVAQLIAQAAESIAALVHSKMT